MNEKIGPQWVLPGHIKPYKEVIERLEAANGTDDYTDVVRFAYGEWSAADEAHLFVSSWRSVPDALFYKAWTSAVCNDRGFYNALFKAEIIEKVMSVKTPYVDENSHLIKLLDNDGYLTIYHGHSKKTLRGSNSWSVNRDMADWFGRRNADGRHSKKRGASDTYRIFTSKVKLADVIAFITDRNEDEVVVLNKNVIKTGSQEYAFDPSQNKEMPPPMFPAM